MENLGNNTVNEYRNSILDVLNYFSLVKQRFGEKINDDLFEKQAKKQLEKLEKSKWTKTPITQKSKTS